MDDMRDRPAILLTGYWPPTNGMLRRFSPSPVQNPRGWVGRDWEGRGFDVYAHFPEFPPGCGPARAREQRSRGANAHATAHAPNTDPASHSKPWGVGEFEVDYRKTHADLTRLAARYDPIAIVTFSRGKPGSHWYPEPACRRWRLPGEPGPANVGQYVSDRRSPGYPFDLPPMADPPGTVYRSTLPMAAIAAAVTRATAGRVNAFVPAMDDRFDFGGAYLSGFVGLLGTRHQHRTPRCRAAGHVHVGIDTPPPDAALATEATVRAVLEAI